MIKVILILIISITLVYSNDISFYAGDELLTIIPQNGLNKSFYQVLKGEGVNTNINKGKSYSHFKSPGIENYKQEIPLQYLEEQTLTPLQTLIIQQKLSQSNNEISQIITTNGNLLGNMGEMGINNGYNQRVIGTNKANGRASSNLVINDDDTLQNGYISYQMSNEGINENITPEGVLLNHDFSNQSDSSFSEEMNNDVYRGTTSASNTKDNLRGSNDYYLKYLSSLSVICLGLVLLV